MSASRSPPSSTGHARDRRLTAHRVRVPTLRDARNHRVGNDDDVPPIADVIEDRDRAEPVDPIRLELEPDADLCAAGSSGVRARCDGEDGEGLEIIERWRVRLIARRHDT